MLLQLDNIDKTYGGGAGAVHALSGFSLSLAPGEFVAVQGPSGCGKSTMLLIAGGLLRPDRGTVTISGQNPYLLSPDERAEFRGRHIGFVFQQFHLVPYLSVSENILAPTLAVSATDAKRRARDLLERFGLLERMHHIPAELSSGERQRTALARALLNRPQVILADEPTGSLDRENAATVLKSLAEFSAEGGSVLLVTHHSDAAQAAQRVIRMQEGRSIV